MHNLGDALLGAGFTEPVVDADRVYFSYGELKACRRPSRFGCDKCDGGAADAVSPVKTGGKRL